MSKKKNPPLEADIVGRLGGPKSADYANSQFMIIAWIARARVAVLALASLTQAPCTPHVGARPMQAEKRFRTLALGRVKKIDVYCSG